MEQPPRPQIRSNPMKNKSYINSIEWIEERFLSKVLIAPFQECWTWLGGLSGGYGHFWNGSKRIMAHRFSYEKYVRKLIDGEQALHHCDNRSCVNPNHLFVGTNLDNVRDKVKKGRQTRGEKSNRGTLKATDIPTIRYMKAQGYTNAMVSEIFKISSGTVSKIANKQIWKHI